MIVMYFSSMGPAFIYSPPARPSPVSPLHSICFLSHTTHHTQRWRGTTHQSTHTAPTAEIHNDPQPVAEQVAPVEGRDVWRIPGLELREQRNLLLDVFDLVVVLVEVERLYGDGLFGLVVDAVSPPFG